MSTTGSVTVHLIVEVKIGSSWGGTCDLDQIRKQGTEEAVNKLARHLEGSGVSIVRVDKRVMTITDGSEPK